MAAFNQKIQKGTEIVTAHRILVSNAVTNATFEPFKVYGLVAVIFFVLCYPLTQYARTLEKRALAH